MIKKRNNDIVWFEFDLFNKEENLLHFQSTRMGGLSRGNYRGLNLGYGKDELNDVLANRLRLCDSIGFTDNNVVAQNQVHGNQVLIIDASHAGNGFYSKEDAIEDCDAMVTNEPDICLWAFGADCLPILFFDPTNRAIGVAHAGWKGTLANIAGETIRTMQENFGSLPEEIIVGLGAGIGVKYYEVGDEVVSAVLKKFEIDEPFLIQNPKTGHFHLDLINTNTFLLYQAGIEPENIEVADLCTYENAHWFYSARRDKETGRQIAGIMLKE